MYGQPYRTNSRVHSCGYPNSTLQHLCCLTKGWYKKKEGDDVREKEDFRNNLQRIDERFPNKEMLTLSDVAKFTGIDRKKIGKDWQDIFTPVGKSKYITKVALARHMSA